MKLPCVKCITLPICKAIALKADTTKAVDVFRAGNELALKCKPIEEYLYNDIEDHMLAPQFDYAQLQILLTYLIEGVEKC